jgi:two-component system, cell cycle response regulator CpdR
LARKILVVDDDPLVLSVLSNMLEEMGCTVVTAGSAPDALMVLSADSSIEILMTDVNMPGMSGIELAQNVRRTRKEVKTLLISGREREGHGFPDLQKPFDQDALARTMEQTTGLC